MKAYSRRAAMHLIGAKKYDSTSAIITINTMHAISNSFASIAEDYVY